MAFRLVHKLMLAGMFLLILSFAFFATNKNLYEWMQSLSFFTAGICFLIIIFNFDNLKTKIYWILIVIGLAGIYLLLKPQLIKLSFFILLKQNEVPLTAANKIMHAKKGNALWTIEQANWEKNNITEAEGLKLNSILKDSPFFFVLKDSLRIYYTNFSRIDISHGLVYYYNGGKPSHGIHLTGNWYY